MNVQTKPSKRLSRWDNARVRPARITPRDVEAFKLLARYTYLPIDDMHAWVAGSLDGFAAHVKLLSRPPNSYLSKPHQQRASADANYRRMVYQLDDRGRQILRDLGFPFLPKRYHHNFVHELMACRIMFSFELGARKLDHVRLIQWPEIFAKMPEATQNKDEPNRIPVSVTFRDQEHNTELTPDWRPFGIERKQDGRSMFSFFPGIEADTGTEPLEAGSNRSDIAGKFAAYLAAIQQNIHCSHFGFPARGFFVPFITGSPARMQHMMDLLRKLTDAARHPAFLFKSFPPFNAFQKPPAPSGDMLIMPWARVGFPPLSLVERR
jgi:hypothetical protein